MSKETEIVNKVAQSPLVTFSLEDYYPSGERILFDIKDWLFQKLILKERDFRELVKNHDWQAYTNKHVALTCTVDAIVPTWAFMLIATKLEPYVATVIHGSLIELEKYLFKNSLDKINMEQFTDKKVVVKGCGALPIPEFAYVEITSKLRKVASSIMYGEPCSTVPLFKSLRK